MINDYKNLRQPGASRRSHRHPLLGIAILGGLALCASALYASFDKETPTIETANSAAQQPTAITPAQSVPVKPAVSEREVALQLPIIETAALPIETAPPTHTPTTQKLTLARLPAEATDSAQTNPQQEDSASFSQAPAITAIETSAEEPAANLPIEVDEGKWLEEKVRSGDSLARIFSRLKLSANLLHRIINSNKQARQLEAIRPGEVLRIRVNEAGEMLELVHQKSAIRSLNIRPDGDSFTSELIDRPLETRLASTSGMISNSLFEAALQAGLSDALTMELANIFGWDIDFSLEIRSGDQFSLIYEEEFLDGKKYRNGNILAAEFINRGKTFRAIRFEDESGRGNYFSPDGKSMRKAFLRSPVDFRRISSRFSSSRKHPVLGKKRAHKGVDYAAASGTPIKAAGDGRVIFRGTKGGYGRTVMLSHGSQYTTLYGHLSKFRGSVKNGSRVSQGQVIGYVGKSGLATGPHLHYEFRVNGVHRNPLTVQLPAAQPLAKKYRDQFAKVSAQLQAELDSLSTTLVANAQ